MLPESIMARTPTRDVAAAQPQSRHEQTTGETVTTEEYLLQTDVHTFAFSLAANSILSFFPFVVLLLTLTRRLFHSWVMSDVILELLRDYLPAGQDFV